MVRMHCCRTLLPCFLMLFASTVAAREADSNSTPSATSTPVVQPVAESPLSRYTHYPDWEKADLSEFVTREVDLSRLIAEYAEKNRLPPEEAKVDALTYLGLLILQRVGRDPEFRSEQVRPGIYRVTAPRRFHEMLPHAMESFRYGKKQICLELRIVQMGETKLKELADHVPRGWSTVGTGKLPLFLPMATNNVGPFRLASSSGKTELVTTSTRTVQEKPARWITLTAAEADDLTAHFRDDPEVSTVMAPRITLFPGQTGSISDTVQRPFVVSVEPVKENGESAESSLQPIIQVVEEGIVTRVKATLRNDETQVQVACDIAFSQIEDVDTVSFIPDGTNQEVTVQLPKLQVRQIHLTKLLDDASTLLIDPQFVKETTRRGMFGWETTTKEHLLLMLSIEILVQ